jgi:hypothetical protein
MAIVQDWKIRPTSARCEITGEPFLDGQPFHACIFEDAETDGFLRRDYSLEAWREVRKTLDPPPFSVWKSVYKAPARASGDEDAGAAGSVEGMLRRFIEEDDPATETARYILALMLERNKTLIPVDTKEAETRTLLFYEHAESGDVFIVADPGLRLDEVESVQRQVAEQLAAEEKRLAERSSASGDEIEAQQEQADDGEEKPQQHGEAAPEAEDESVSPAGEEAAEEFGADSGIGAGEELADEPDDQLEHAEAGENPPPPNDHL